MSSEWPVVRLGDYCLKIGSGATPRGGKNVYLELGDTALIRSQNIYNEGFKDEGVVYITQAAADKLSNVEVQEKDILINITGDSVARTCLAPSEYLPARVNQHVAIIRPDPEEFDARFLRYFLVSPTQQELLLTIASAGATRNALTKGHLESLEVCKPRLKEQKAIAWQLEKLDNKIQVNNQLNQTLEQMAQAIFKSWFVDFEPVKAKIAALEAGGSEDDALLAAMQTIAGSTLFATDAADADAPTQLARLQAEHPEQYATLRATAELFPSAMQESELGEIPEGWEASTLSDFCEFQNGYAFKGKDWADSGFPVVKIGSVKPGFVDLTKVSYVSSETVAGLERFELKAGDILVGMTGYPGETGLVPNYADRVFLNQRVGRFIPNEKYLYAYIFSAVRGSEFKVFVESQAHGSAQANISGKAILQYPLISGSKNLMMRFYEVVNPQIQQMICLNAESSQLGELRDTLLPKLLSGELSVSAATDQITQAEEAIDV